MESPGNPHFLLPGFQQILVRVVERIINWTVPCLCVLLENGPSGGEKQALEKRPALYIVLRRDRGDLRLQHVEHDVDILADLR